MKLNSPHHFKKEILLSKLLGFYSEILSHKLSSDLEINLKGIASLHRANNKQISFSTRKDSLRHLVDSDAGLIIVPDVLMNQDIPDELSNRIIFAKNPYKAIVSILKDFYEVDCSYPAKNISSKAILHPSAVVDGVIEAGVVVGANAVIHSGVYVAKNTRIDANAVIYPNVSIGQNSHVMSGAIIGQRGFGFFQDEASLNKVPHYGGVEIGNDVEVGVLCSIASGFLEATTIGNNTCFDSMVHIGHNAIVGNCVYLAAHVALAGSAVLEDGVQIGGGSKVDNGIIMRKGSSLAAMSAATNDVKEGTRVAGFPAVDIKRWRKFMVKLRNLK